MYHNYHYNSMDKKIKNYLGIGALVSMVILAISSLIFANIYSKSIEPSSYRSFSVSGEGKVVAIPDVAQFTFSVITEGGKDIASIQQENAQKANRQTLSAAGNSWIFNKPNNIS